jgi:c(7)-type cytochrome triheme protein
MKKLVQVASCIATILIAVCAAALFLRGSAALATPSLQTALVVKYPGIRETQTDSCTTCHMPAKKDFLNDYGLALKEAKMDFAAIEELDSDKDGKSNIDEIMDESFPGSHATSPEYYIFHINVSDNDPELGKVHFNHEMHVFKDSYLSRGRCNNCHAKHLFPKVFNDNISVREVAHQICWRCHETSGSNLAPKDCTSCHEGIKDIIKDVEQLIK